MEIWKCRKTTEKVLLTTSDNNKEVSISYISLGHELIHAYRDITGQSTYSQTAEYRGTLPKGVKDGKGVDLEEFETVGLFLKWSNGNSKEALRKMI